MNAISQSDSDLELRFKIFRVETAGHEVLGPLSNLIVARAAFDVYVSLWSSAWIELRLDVRVIEKHGARDLVRRAELPRVGCALDRRRRRYLPVQGRDDPDAGGMLRRHRSASGPKRTT
jgi:hypothetical protein